MLPASLAAIVSSGAMRPAATMRASCAAWLSAAFVIASLTEPFNCESRAQLDVSPAVRRSVDMAADRSVSSACSVP